MTNMELPRPSGRFATVELIEATPASVHELELLHRELETLHTEVRETIGRVERRNLELIRDLQQTIGQHLADHPHYPPRGWAFARRARGLIDDARKGRDGANRLVRASKILDQLVEEAWVQL